MRRVALVLAMVLPLGIAGCGDSTGPGSAAGTYALRSIDGDPVPVLIDVGPPREEIVEGFIRLNANGTFTARHVTRLTSSTSTTDVIENLSGTYTRSRDQITLTFEDPDGFGIVDVDAFLDGDRLTLDTGFELWVYER